MNARMPRQDAPRDDNNNILRQLEFEELKKNGNKRDDFNEKFYDSSSEDESLKNGKQLDDKSESSEGEEQSDYAKIIKRSEEICAERTDDKPTQSYIALIAMAILSSPNRKMVLSDIYQFILDKYPFYKGKDKSWRNSIRHNLSLNECFVKAGRSENGKGNYWAIHPVNIEDFAKGDYRRRRAKRKTKRPSHSSDFYTECFQPYTILSPILGLDRKAMPSIWGGYGRRHSIGQKIVESIPKQQPRKSFTIDSILGLENDKKLHPYHSGTYVDLGSRRHHSAPSYRYQRCPLYEGSAFSPFDRNSGAFEYYPLHHGIPVEYHRAPEYLQYTMCSSRESVQELKRLRPSFL